MKNIIFLILLLIAVSANAQYSNRITGEMAFTLPDPLLTEGGYLSPPSQEDYYNAGWEPLSSEQIDDIQQAEKEAVQQEYLRKVSEVAKDAAVFRAIYEHHFGPGAVTNRNITEDDVAEYFTTRRFNKIMGTETNDISADGLDILALNRGFEKIKMITGDGSIWTFPWDLIPNAIP